MSNKPALKLATLSLTSAIPALFLGTFLAKLSVRPESIILAIDPSKLIKFLLILIASGTTLSLTPSFNSTKQELALATLAPTAGFVFPLLVSSRRLTFLAIISSLLFFAAAFKLGLEIQSSLNNTLKIRVGETYPPKIKSFFLAVALILSLNFAVSFFIKTKQMGGLKIPVEILEKATTPFVPLLEDQLGKQIERQFGERFEERLGIQGENEILKFLGSELEETLKEGEGRQRFGLTPENLSLDKVKISPEGKLDLSEAIPDLAETFKNQIETFIAPYQKQLVILLAVSLFLAIHFLGRIAVLPCPLLIALSLYILKVTKFTKIEKEMVEAEKLKL